MESKFSKNLNDIGEIKKYFFNENDALLNNSKKVNNFYNKQKQRKYCKACNIDLAPHDYDLENHGVKYKICRNCAHLNGLKEDSEDFNNFMYKGESYSKTYIQDYEKRIINVYMPKATFLKESLKNFNNIKEFSVTDFGCGGGHFVNSLQNLNINSVGFDISSAMIKLAKDYWEIKNKSQNCTCFNVVESEKKLYKTIENNQKDVSSFIGVLEHLSRPNHAIESFLRSKAKYLYCSLPLFSISVILENVFKDIFPRQLGGGHTHLYTFESIDYLCKKYNLKKISQWHFGTDAMDLNRSLLIELNKNKSSEFMMKTYQNKFMSEKIINQLQEILDKNFCGSEIHMLLEK